MPLTALQKDLLAVLAANRSEESHFAGGVVLNAAEDSARYSHDFDILHELAEEVTRAGNQYVENLRTAGFAVQTLSREGEWEFGNSRPKRMKTAFMRCMAMGFRHWN